MDLVKSVSVKALKSAGSILLSNLGKITYLKEKQKNDFLTNVDLQVEEKIKRIIKDSFPNHGFYGEEQGLEKGNSKHVWYIDPISSTSNYIHSFPHFAASIALEKNGTFILSAVYDPMMDELFYAQKGRGAFLNNKRINVSSVSELSNALVFIGIHKRGDIKPDFRHFEKLYNIASEVRRIGSTSLQMCYVACGRAEAHINNHSDIFAIPAGKVILEEAGGVLTDFEGSPWTLNSKTIVAFNSNVHNKILKTLNS